MDLTPFRAVEAVAGEIGCLPAGVALASTVTPPRVDALLLGASRPVRVRRNVAARPLALSDEQRTALFAAGALEPAFRHPGFYAAAKRSVPGGSDVATWRGGVGR